MSFWPIIENSLKLGQSQLRPFHATRLCFRVRLVIPKIRYSEGLLFRTHNYIYLEVH